MCESCVGNREVRDRRSWNPDRVEDSDWVDGKTFSTKPGSCVSMRSSDGREPFRGQS